MTPTKDTIELEESLRECEERLSKLERRLRLLETRNSFVSRRFHREDDRQRHDRYKNASQGAQ